MFSKLALITSISFAILTVATPASFKRTNEPASQCTTGPIQCCDSTSTAKSPSTAVLLASLGVVVQDVDALVGLTCSGITVGAGGSGCSANALCCDNDNFNGVIALGCIPVDLSL